MNNTWFAGRLLAWGLLGAVMVGACGGLHALDRGTTDSGIAYVSGGIDQTERAELREDEGRFNFWLTTASRRSGAYLAEAQVRVSDLRTGQVVFERTMDGPWLLLALPAGRYEVRASYPETPETRPQTQSRSVILGPRARRQMVLYFDTPDLVGSDQEPTVESRPRHHRLALPKP